MDRRFAQVREEALPVMLVRLVAQVAASCLVLIDMIGASWPGLLPRKDFAEMIGASWPRPFRISCKMQALPVTQVDQVEEALPVMQARPVPGHQVGPGLVDHGLDPAAGLVDRGHFAGWKRPCR